MNPIAKLTTNLILTGLFAALTVGCSSRFPAEQVPRMQWLVLPFEQPEAMADTSKEIQGWWFGATTIRQNNRAGAMFADTVNSAMARLGYVNLFNTIDLKYYYAEKERMLEEAYPHLEREELKELIEQVPAVDFARELHADKLLTGTILKQHLAENRTVHTWKSRVDVEIRVVDVKSGQVEWSRRYAETDRFVSEKAVQEKIAKRLVEDLEEGYFWPMVEK